jgi:tetratricopeptide (TPR) repeat protein
VAIGVLALSLISPFLSARYVNQAFSGWRADLEGAYDDLDRAHDLNRLDDLPFLAQAAIAQQSGDPARAIAAAEEAVDLKPEEFAGHVLLAELYAQTDPSRARAEAARALELNPLDFEVRELARDLGVRVRDFL